MRVWLLAVFRYFVLSLGLGLFRYVFLSCVL